MVGRRGENFGAEKRWKKKNPCEQGGWDFCSSAKRLQRAHPEMVHWWLLVHSRPLPEVKTFQKFSGEKPRRNRRGGLLKTRCPPKNGEN